MKFIFLDYDGVLLTLRTKFTKPDTACIAALNELLTRTDANIVVTSNWRTTASNEIDRLTWWGTKNAKSLVLGVTPSVRDGTRGDEIQAWLRHWNYTVGKPIPHAKTTSESFVILDDDDDMDDALRPYLVQTDTQVGLTMKDVEKAYRILNAEPTTNNTFCYGKGEDECTP